MASIIFDDGKEINLSEETTARLKEELLKPGGFERFFSSRDLRLSSIDRGGMNYGSWPVRLSLLHATEGGTQAGNFSGNNHGNLPGITINIEDAKRLSKELLNCIEYIKNHQ